MIALLGGGLRTGMERIDVPDLRTGVLYTVKANAGYFSKSLTLVAIQDGLFTFSDGVSKHILTRYDISDGHAQIYREKLSQSPPAKATSIL